MADEHDLQDHTDSEKPERRRLLRAAALGGAGLAVGAAVGATAGAASAGGSSDSRKQFAIDVACLGNLARPLLLPWLTGVVDAYQDRDPGDLRGSFFWFEGWIYPEGTIAGDGFIPTEIDRIGTWFCRGNFIVSPDRGEPHLASVQEYYLSPMDSNPIGSRLLVSQGLEGRNEDGWEALRAVTGGTGEYRSARGEVLQRQVSLNSTELPNGNNAPNFRFEFDIDLP